MKVILRLHGPLQKYGPRDGFFEVEVPAEIRSARELLQHLHVPVSAVAFVTVNGTKQDPDLPLVAGAQLTVYPRVAGGRPVNRKEV